MKKFTGAGIALLLGTTAAYAGGMDRSGQSITALFEEGTYAEISFGSVSPDVTGVSAIAYGGTASGNVAPNYTQMGFAYKTDVNENFSFALIVDNPFGAMVEYNTAGYLLNGTAADVPTRGYTLLGQYHLNENVSIYGGPRLITASGEYTRVFSGTTVYHAEYSSDTDVGYVVGAAYEIPEIALRAALTYSSATEFELDGTGTDIGGAMTTTLNAAMPQSVNLDLQSGIAENTLAFVNVRWADWSEAHLTDSNANSTITPTGLPAPNAFVNPDRGVLSDFTDSDVTTFTVGIGRKLSDNFAGQIALGYEKSTGIEASNLAPTDGYKSISIGGAYTFDNGMELSGGVRYVDLGDATTSIASFTDNSVTAIGLKLAYNY